MNASNDCSPPIETTEFTLVLTPRGGHAAEGGVFLVNKVIPFCLLPLQAVDKKVVFGALS
jgi:hypothetical protein